MTGRARGRARGRAKAASAQEEPQRRPGEQQPQQPPVQQAPVAAPVAGSGRASIRGGTRGEPRPGQGNGAAAAVTAQMGQMDIGTGDGMRAQKSDRRARFTDPSTRPAHIQDKKGSSGNKIPLVTNYFELKKRPEWHLYQYHVDYNPPIDSKKMRIGMLYEHEELLGKTKAFDGMVLFLPRRLDEVTEVYSQRKYDGAKIRVTIKLTNELPPSHPECLHMYNVIFRKILGYIEMKEIGRHYYNPQLAIPIPQHKLEVWPGFTTSIAQFESDVMLCADISHKILRSDTVLDVMYDIYSKPRQNFHEVVTKRLVGEIILTRYNNKTYRIDDIDWDKHPSDKFPKADGTEISYVEYFKTAHDITVHDDQQPLLVIRPKKKDIRRGQEGPIHLLPEFCTMTGLSEDVRADFHVMKDIATHTRVAPENRTKTLQAFITQINKHKKVQDEMKGWGLSFADDLLHIQGRILPPEKIFQANASFGYKPAEADWSREMRGKSLVSVVNLDNWLLLCTRRDSSKAQDFVATMMRVAGPMGMRVSKPTICELPDDRVDTFLKSIKSELRPDTQLVMCILPSNRKDRYDAIKKVCCVDHPVPSQVIVTRTISKPQMLMSVSTKVVIQLNCKLGGEVWAVDIPLKKLMIIGIDSYHDSAQKGQSVGGFVASINTTCTRFYSRTTFQHSHQELCDGLRLKNTMYIGIDTYHDSAAKGQSIGGVVCSLNKSATRFYSRVTRQHAHQELIDGLTVACHDALGKFHEVNGSLPDRICVYRDGVGDGQLAAVYEHEVQQLLDCFKAVSANYTPKVAFIVVKKRINSRFFAQGGSFVQNPPPGTVIDDQVTKPEWYDFFLVSQSVRQGTVTPTHYNVLWDTFGLKPDLIQRLTYKMTHLYYNWPGTIRVPAPCQYAHKLAFLVGQSIHKDPSLALSDRLFFL